MSGSLPESVASFVAEASWRYAKTMPEWPHWYVMKLWQPGTFRERTTRYLFVGDYKYWVMDPSIEATDLINRARIDGAGPSSLGTE